MTDIIHTFAGNPLDRADAERRDPDWLDAAERNPHSRYLPMWRLNVLIDAGAGDRLGWLPPERIAELDVQTPPVFLGLDGQGARFALDVSTVERPVATLGLSEAFRFEDSRAAGMTLSASEAGILAQSRSQLAWHEKHQFCSVCGTPTNQARGGHLRVCPNCGAQHFPRTDPVAIMVISDGDRCLLGQSAGRLARTGMYSALAGFIDQGESIEEAVRREVREEAGVEVGAVRYHSSQPWPFPSSLMIGCHGDALSTDITIDPVEMADVRWFERDEARAALAGEHPTLKVPGPVAIAHHLIRAWVDGSAERPE
ncbi:MAG: NAD(+) diphosphatase [Gammaproteobacteria bacterium]|nr:NAD(+) diphosphatase [Gammaproteobacteria bacterium]